MLRLISLLGTHFLASSLLSWAKLDALSFGLVEQ